MTSGDAAAAAARYIAASESASSPHQACLAAVSAALALLATQQPDALLQAVNILQKCHLYDTIDASLAYAERYATATSLPFLIITSCIYKAVSRMNQV